MPGVAVITCGLAEVATDGKPRQDELVPPGSLAWQRMLKPNHLELLNTDPVVQISGTVVPIWPPPGGGLPSMHGSASTRAVTVGSARQRMTAETP